MVTCERCNGTGKTVFAHVEGGVCFRCAGTGKAEPMARKVVAIKRGNLDRAGALERLRRVYRNAVAGDTMEDVRDGAYLRDVLEAMVLAPETVAHFAALPGWDGIAALAVEVR